MIKEFNSAIVSLSVNIPGIDKVTEDAGCIFEAAMKEIEKLDLKIQKVQTLKTASGYEAQISVDEDAVKIKKSVVKIEENHPLGRFMDIDVFDANMGQISRKDISMTGRKCFICEDDAKICARSRRHSLDKLLAFIHSQVEQYDGD